MKSDISQRGGSLTLDIHHRFDQIDDETCTVCGSDEKFQQNFSRRTSQKRLIVKPSYRWMRLRCKFILVYFISCNITAIILDIIHRPVFYLKSSTVTIILIYNRHKPIDSINLLGS
jgi:hypothetical protein